MTPNILDFCSTLTYAPFVWRCYFNAKKLQFIYWGELYSNIDHVVLFLDGKFYDHTGEVQQEKNWPEYIPIDPEEVKRYEKMSM